MLEPDQYAPGSTLKSPGGKELTVVDSVTGSSGNQFLMVSLEGSDSLQFVPLSALRDGDSEWESVTDDTDVTDSQGSSSSEPDTGSQESGTSGTSDTSEETPTPKRKRS